jgi:hypothetical protein
MKKGLVLIWTVFVGTFLLVPGILCAQQVLDNDSIIMGNATGSPGQTVVVPIYSLNTVPYQGWTLPIKFGSASSPVTIDSLSLANSCMMVPFEWDFIAPFENNNLWGNTKTCGVAAVVAFMGGDTLPPGYHLVMRLFIKIDAGASSQTILIDTTTCSWTSNGPLQSLCITYHSGSYLCRVKPGSIIIPPVGVAEENGRKTASMQVFPTIMKSGGQLTVRCCHSAPGRANINITDIAGRKICPVYDGCVTAGLNVYTCSVKDLASGVYFVLMTQDQTRRLEKFVIQ